MNRVVYTVAAAVFVVFFSGGGIDSLRDLSGAFFQNSPISSNIDKTASFPLNTSFISKAYAAKPGGGGGSNTLPVAEAGYAQTVAAGNSVQLDGSRSTDIDGNPLTYAWQFVSVPGGSTAVLSDAITLDPTFTADLAGDYVVQLIVNDGTGDSPSDTVTISTTNSAPVADAGVDQVVTAGVSVPLDGSRSADVDGNLLTYSWSILQAPIGSVASITNPTAVRPTLNTDLDGDYVVELILSDGILQGDSDTVTISTGNVPPVADAGRDRVTPVSTTEIIGNEGIIDANGAELTYQWSVLHSEPGSVVTLLDETLRRTSVSYDLAGTYVLQMTANDGTAAHSDTVIVTSGNVSPVANAGAEQAINLNDIVQLDAGDSTDLNGDLLSFEWALIAKPAGSTATLSDATSVRPSFTVDQAGTYVAQVTVSDGNSKSLPATVVISTGNVAPVANAGPDQFFVTNPGTVILDGTASSDANADSVTYRWVIIESPARSNATINDSSLANPILSTDKVGNHIIQLIVNDGTTDSPADKVFIASTGNGQFDDNANLYPEAKAGPDQTAAVTLGLPVQLDGSASYDLAGGTIVSYRWDLIVKPAGSAAVLSDPALINPTFTPDVDGVYVAQLIVEDDYGHGAPDTVVIGTPPTPNTQPIANAGPDQGVNYGAVVQLDGTGSYDPENDPLTYFWLFASQPAGSTATLDNPVLASPSFTPDKDGIYELSLTVDDGLLPSDPDSVFITVANGVPVANAGLDLSTSFVPDLIVQFDGSGSSDPDGNPLSFNWTLVSSPVGSTAVLTETTTTTPSLAPDLVGDYVAELIVSDGLAFSTPDQVTLTVTPFDPAPVLDPVGDQTVALGSTLTLTLTGSDPDLDPISFSAAPLPLPDGASLDSVTGEFIFVPDETQIGVFNLTFIISDGSLSDSEAITVTVTAPPGGTPTAYIGRLLDANSASGGQTVAISNATVNMLNSGETTITDANGYFTLSNIPSGEQVLDIVAGGADLAPDGSPYADFREKVILMDGVTNVVIRPIYLPRIEMASESVPIDPLVDLVVTNSRLGVTLTIPAGTITYNGGDATGMTMTISEVPKDFAPVALPDFLDPALLISIQPVGMAFSTPAAITFPNLDAMGTGNEMDLYSVDPDVGTFSIAGVGQITANGIETISGGVNDASWHAFLAPLLSALTDSRSPENNNSNKDQSDCEKGCIGSQTALSSGELIIKHNLPSYRSLERNRGLQFTYTSTAADPSPIISNDPTIPVRTATPDSMSITLSVAGIDQGINIFTNTSSLTENNPETIRQAVQFDAREFATGLYPYEFELSNNFPQSSVSAIRNEKVLVRNDIDSPFGAGWTLGGVSRIIPQNADGTTIVLTEGDGSTLLFGEPDAIVGPVAYWPFDDGAAPATDAIGDHDGVFVGAPVYTTNDVAPIADNIGAMTFDGANDYIEIAHVPDIDFNTETDDSMSLAAWIKVTDPLSAFYIMGKTYNCGSIVGHRIGYALTQNTDIYGNLVDGLGLRSNWGYIISSSVDAPVGDWMHVAVTVDGVGSSPSVASIASFYINGVKVAEESTIFKLESNDKNLRIGNACGNYFPGLIDEVYLYDRVLSPREVAALANQNEPVAGTLVSPPGDYSTLIKNPDNTYTRTFKDTSRTEFDATGLQTAWVDANGNTTTYAYNVNGELETITDPAGKVTTLAYAGGLLTTITDPTTRVTSFVHDADGNLTSITDPDASQRQFAYDDRHRITTQTSKRSLVTTYTYDFAGRNTGASRPDGSTRSVAAGQVAGLVDPASGQGSEAVPAPVVRPDKSDSTYTDGNNNTTTTEVDRFRRIIKSTDALNRIITTSRDSSGNPTRIKDARGRVSEMVYDNAGNMTSRTDAVGTSVARSTTLEYHATFNKVTKITDPAGKITIIVYDAAGNPLTITDPLTGERSFTYNAQGQVLTATDQNNETTTITYDANGNVETVTNPELDVTRFIRDTAGRVTQAIEGFGTPEARTNDYTFDDLNRMLTATDGEAAVTTLTYDATGNLDTTTTPTGETTTYTYDEMNRIATIDHPVSGLTTNTYDPQGNLATVTDTRGKATSFDYDAANQRTVTTDRLLGETTFTYDANGNLQTLRDARLQTTTFAYDALNRVMTRTNPLSQATSFTYDTRDNLATTTDPKGQVVSRVYDDLSRLTEITYTSIDSGTADQIDLVYDAVSNLTAANDNDSALAFTHDGLDRVLTAATVADAGTVLPAVTLTNGYNAVGDRVQVDDTAGLGGSTYYAFDGNGQLTQLTTSGAQVINLTYDAAGRPDTITRPNGANSNFGFDAAGRLSTLTHGPGGSLLADLGYGYDVLGNITAITEPARNRNYTYDDLERLITGGTATEAETYAYDAVGNRTTSYLSAAHTTNTANRLTGDDAFAYIYDANGNLASKTDAATGLLVTAYQYDALDRMVQITFPDATTASYRYDALGRRIEKNISGAITRYVYDGGDIGFEYDGANALQARYSHGDRTDQPLAQERGGATYYYHADHQGSVIALTDTSGVVVNDYEYDSYGRLLVSSETITNPYTFTGRELDAESGLYYYRARYYDPDTGRFLAQDPIGFAAGDANLYRYVGSNPVNYTDPSGLAIDVVADVVFIGYDLYRIAADNVFGNCDNLGENLAALGGDIAGAAVPGLTGVGLGIRAANTANRIEKAASKGAKGNQKGGLNLFKKDHKTSTRSNNWKEGDRFLYLQNKVTPRNNWKQNSGRLREEMRKGDPIYDSYRNSSGIQLGDDYNSFINAERKLLESRGWKYDYSTGAYYPPK